MVSTKRSIDGRGGVEDDVRTTIVTSTAALITFGLHAWDTAFDGNSVADMKSLDVAARLQDDSATLVAQSAIFGDYRITDVAMLPEMYLLYD